MRAILKWSVGFAVVMLFAGRASGQEAAFGDAGHVALSAERLSGYVHTKETVTVAGMETSQSQDSFTLLTNPLGALSGYAWPRIAFDGFVARGVSVGGAVGIFHLSPSMGSATGYLFAPRVGYAANLGPRAAIWPRLGITYERISSESGAGTTSTQSALALTIEAPLAILVVPRFLILVGPTLDLGLSGSQSSGGMSIDDKYTEFGFQAGILVLL